MAAKAKATPRKQRLKVFRTAIGFHDAYVAAPSRKAALAAWGADKDLFARGVAEEVDDPALTAEPLAAPGTVVRRLRAAPDELPAPKRKVKAAAAAEPVKPRQPPKRSPPPRPPPPPPSRGLLDEARRAVDELGERHAAEQRELAARERALADERRTTEARQGKELRLGERQLAAAEEDYAARLREWREKGGGLR